jgi:hypothetical protein
LLKEDGRWELLQGAQPEMITQFTYERVFNLGNYESERIGAVATVEGGDVVAAYQEARDAVYASRTSPAAPPAQAEFVPQPASDKQRAFIASLQDQMGWISEQLSAYAEEQGVDLVAMTRREASSFIDGLKQLAEEQGTIPF